MKLVLAPLGLGVYRIWGVGFRIGVGGGGGGVLRNYHAVETAI